MLSTTLGLTTPAAVTIVLATVAVAVVLLVIRAQLLRKALSPAQRVGFDVLPSDTFDPTPEEIDRYAAQLARARRAVRRGTSRSGHAIRVRIDAAEDGTVRYRIEGHRRASSILGTPGFHDVELRPHPPDSTESPVPPTPTSPDGGTPKPSREPREPSP